MKNMYKKAAIFLTLLLAAWSNVNGSGIPRLQKNANGAYQLIVNDKPFMMVAGELHNSSSSSAAYMAPLWPQLSSLNMNTVISSISWEQFEPEEGVFDYALVDYLISSAREHHLKLCFIWFASWKNGQSSYLPLWVKRDTRRFFRVKTKEGKSIETVSPFCMEARKADAKAFAALMQRIKEVDQDQTVIMMQPENEVGLFQDFDYSRQALEAYEKEAPPQLLKYLTANKRLLKEEVRSVWEAQGAKTKGSWKTVFGDNPQSKEFLMAWQYATYINEVAAAGKAQYPLPMYVNAWLVQKPEDLPGVYPNGGPVSRVMDIWKAAAPSIDVLAPDIYLPNFKEIVAQYHRSDNPLLIPESALDIGRAYYAFGEHGALCFAPFGIEGVAGDFVFSESYAVLQRLTPLITENAGSKRMFGVWLYGEEKERKLTFDSYTFQVKADKTPAYGIIIQTKTDEFIVAGMNFRITVSSTDSKKTGYVGQVWEGDYINGEWKPDRLLNGDETGSNTVMRGLGIKHKTNEEASNMYADIFSPQKYKSIVTPGIYKLLVYTREK
ncbi:beta-galactosidase [Bacteroidia bacterium]|nr:beta-galactosidase [Bacteroidia bacterium]